MGSKMNWDRARTSGSGTGGDGSLPDFGGVARKRDVLKALNIPGVNGMSPERIKTAYSDLTMDQLSKARAIARGERTATGVSRGATTLRAPRAASPARPKSKVLSPKAQIARRKELIKKVRETAFADRQHAFENARAEFNRLDTAATNRLKTGNSLEAVKLERQHAEWTRRLEEARLGRG